MCAAIAGTDILSAGLMVWSRDQCRTKKGDDANRCCVLPFRTASAAIAR